tara:strand:- start:11574 stop:11711 length:138 start_codon:yes stop_codon:yes gene_type:complete
MLPDSEFPAKSFLKKAGVFLKLLVKDEKTLEWLNRISVKKRWRSL